VLLNTYYGNAPALRFPEMIQLFADERLTPLADAIVADPAQRLWLLQHSADRFGYETQQSFDPHGVAVTSVLPSSSAENTSPTPSAQSAAGHAPCPARSANTTPSSPTANSPGWRYPSR
jgi:hypothetical protein